MYHSASIMPALDDEVYAYVDADTAFIAFEGGGRFAVHVPGVTAAQQVAWLYRLSGRVDELVEQIELSARTALATTDSEYADKAAGGGER